MRSTSRGSARGWNKSHGRIIHPGTKCVINMRKRLGLALLPWAERERRGGLPAFAARDIGGTD